MIFNSFEELIESGKKYEILYLDPPWFFSSYGNKHGTGMERSEQSHYSCMTMEDIQKLPIQELAEKNCLLYMWVTDPLIDKQIQLPIGWGFEYLTMGWTWVKTNKKKDSLFMAMGYYGRSNAEYCLLFKRGKPKRPLVNNIIKTVIAKVGVHSQKPDIFSDNIDKMYSGSKLELFARRAPKDHWDYMGNELIKEIK